MSKKLENCKVLIKRNKICIKASKNDFYQQTELEAMYQVLAWSSDDFKEGCAAFAEKRKPVFKNR